MTRRAIAERCDPESAKARTVQPLIERGLVLEDVIDGDVGKLRLLSLTPRGRELASAIRQTRECLSCS
jgi:DNA-binding MarR family transcriptional regulator